MPQVELDAGVAEIDVAVGDISVADVDEGGDAEV